MLRIIKRKTIVLFIWYMLIYAIQLNGFKPIVFASNWDGVHMLNNSTSNNYFLQQSYSSNQPENVSVNNLKEPSYDEQPIYGEQEYNSYNILAAFLNTSSNELAEDLYKIPVSNLFDPNYTNNSYNSSYSLLNGEYSNSSYIGQDSSFNNTLFRNNWVEPEISHTFGSPSTSIKYNPEKEYTLLELNSTNLACNNIQLQNISTNPMPYSPPACSENRKLSRITKSLESTQTTSTSIDGKQKNQNSESAISYISININYNTVNKLKKISFITSSIRNSDEYKSIVTALHDYILEFIKNEQDQDNYPMPLSLDSMMYTEDEYSKSIKEIRDNANKYKNVWVALYLAKKENIHKRLNLIGYLSKQQKIENDIFQSCDLSYYPNILSDLNAKCKSSYRVPIKNSSKTNLKVESDLNQITLGIIYTKRRINLLWHAESMLIAYNNQVMLSSSINIVENLKNRHLKKQLLLILCLPEIYEDLFYMKYEEIHLLKQKIMKSNASLESKNKCAQFCIIEYLYGKVHNNHSLMENAYSNILKIKKRLFRHNSDDIDVYKCVYKTFAYFYKHSYYLYETNINGSISNSSFLEPNNCYLYMKQYTKIDPSNTKLYQGKDVISIPDKRKCSMVFKYTNTKENSRKLDKIIKKSIVYTHAKSEIISIPYSPHYHVQLVDNSTHQMHIVHIPFFVSTEDGSEVYHYIHTIENIVNHASKLLCNKTMYNQRYNNTIYPFKYNRNDKTWSLITKLNNDQIKKRKLENSNSIHDMDKTIEEMHNDGFDIVLYYIEEGLDEIEFLFAQLNPISIETINTAYKENKAEAKKLFDRYEPNIGVPRIPLFLPRLMTSVVHFGPYVLKPEKYKFESIKNYQDLVPIKFSSSIDRMVKKKDRKQTIIEILNKFRREIYYYSDFYILGINSFYEDCDCYNMNIKQKEFEDNEIELSWYIKIQFNTEEYINYNLDLRIPYYSISTIETNMKLAILSLLLKMLQRKHVSQDILRYGLCIYTKKSTGESFTISLLCPEMRAFMNELFSKDNEMYYILSPPLKENIESLKNSLPIDLSDILNIYISIKNVNYTKSKLGLHYNIMNALF
ncbi:uncharacterized protein NEPG_02213 [Nematocida parisii ERTm1]|uniref:Uncharacterized protein n=1 Tax=Nematocida parisii (strain ERTm3) TaxID=935791 RepID=I3EEE0_NEMP3|nr:uncharacterized protein NEPG_02213 [Nematocida parisii ERTm1]EIJ87587.1 hypothetical protein NEQG_02134 [Nematocida parisii ERTm3]EIJ92814.1 hypothetical protein NEPG_02213 [Nematocida parisii ERTm1]|eukprot:XP_013060040.1 hypothetical protein NEPG_02213 [Nematocida parisii ERTm1]